MNEQFELKIQLSVLNDLGIKLYSNTPAVLSELVANSWDADAENVSVVIHSENQTITIQDDGCGMNFDDLQNKYLTVGYQKRGPESDQDTTPKGRHLMGRKGIGKLSMFSIAKKAEIHTVKRGKNGEEYRGGLILDLEEIQKAAKRNSSYTPVEVASDDVKDLEKGTRILLSDIDKRLSTAVKHLRTRLARRFSVTGPQNNFEISVNDEIISPSERGYFHRLQYVSWIGDAQKNLYRNSCSNLAKKEGETEISEVTVIFDGGQKGVVSGWIGFVHESKQMIDGDGESLNRITLMVRGKLAAENLLPSFKENRVGKTYLMGELHADFIDDTQYEDIALSSRQGIKENASRYENLIESLEPVVKSAITEWDKKRKKKDEKDILNLPGISQWMEMLVDDGDKKFAKSLVSKIASATSADKATRKTTIKYCVLAFETLRYQDRLHRLEDMTGEQIANLAEVFSDISRLEATAYGEIAKGRIAAIGKLQNLVKEKALEKEFQILIANNLWLLDAAWERAVQGDEFVEKSIKEVWGKLQDAKEVEDGRVDLAYKTVAGLDVIVELKRASRKDFDTTDLLRQCKKYLAAYRAAKKTQQNSSYRHKIFIVVGELPKDWKNSDEESREGESLLDTINASLLTYEQLLASARQSYNEYLKSREGITQTETLLAAIDAS